jgi:NAD-dependent DNA ligase
LGHGIGAEVRIIRSGDIIPKIVKTERRMPMNKPTASFGQYTFDGTNLIAASDKENHKELLVRFFHHTGLDGFGPALAEEMASHEAPTWAVCRMTTIKHWLPFTSGSTKTSAKLAQEVVALRERITLDVAMSASGVFDKGVGSTRIRNLLKSNPRAFDYLTMPYSMAARKFLLTAAQETAGCGPSFAKLLEKGLKAWCDWYKNSKLSIEPPVAQKQVALVTGTKYSGKKFSWTGYRDAAQEAAVTAGGGEVIKLGSKTNVLFYNPNGKFMDKVEAAKAKGVKVVTFDKF